MSFSVLRLLSYVFVLLCAGTRVVDWKSSKSYVNKAIKSPPQSPWIVIQVGTTYTKQNA